MILNPYTITNEQLIMVIENHLKAELSVKYLAEYFGYSEYYFSRLFKNQMGTSIMDYVCKRRLIMASEEIMGGRNIIDVAIEFGWQSHSGFTKAFKKEYGFSPSLLKVMIIELNNLGGSDMEHIFLVKTEEHASKEQLIQILKETIAYNGIEIEDNIDDMIKYAVNAYKGIKRYSGDEYVTHTLNVAMVLAQLETDINTIVAGLFCDVTKKSTHALSELLCELPVQVQLIIKEVSDVDIYEIDKLSDSALLVKIAERLHNMRTIEFMDESKRSVKANETIDIFMPIARRIGNNKIIFELNDLSVKYMHK